MKKIILTLIFGIFLISLASASPSFYVKQYEPYDITFSCTDDSQPLGFCSPTTECNITIIYPNSTTMVNNQNATNLFNGKFNYSLDSSQTSINGKYIVRVGCSGNGLNNSGDFTYEVNPLGKESKSFSLNPILIFLTIFAFIFIGLGIWIKIPALGFIGAILLILAGMYTMIYGFGDVTNLYTRGVGIALLGLGLIFMISSAYEWLTEEG